MPRKALTIVIFLFFSLALKAQFIVTGRVTDSLGIALQGVSVKVVKSAIGTSTDAEGRFSFGVKQNGDYTLEFSHIGYITIRKEIVVNGEALSVDISLAPSVKVLEGVSIETEAEGNAVSSVTIKSTTIENVSAPFNDISNILSTLPSVVSNNELSSSYSVRGGNYDENLVRVNGFPVYRPFLVRAGQQEGLSFINNDLVRSVEFSAGGWDAQYGGKMSSLLLADYKKATGWHGGASISFLGGSAYFEGKLKDASFLIGARHKRSRYLLNSLDIDGQYDPRFTDVQNYWNVPVSDKLTLEALLSYASNNYQVTPENGQITFGTFNQELRFEVAFEGQEEMLYNTMQGAVKANYEINDRVGFNVLTSVMKTYENENGDVEGGYRLCDVDKNLGSSTFNECAQIRGIGTLYRYARNNLDAQIIDLESNGWFTINSHNKLLYGVRLSNRNIYWKISEYSFTDSVGYVQITSAQASNNNLEANELNAYAQHQYKAAQFGITYGVYGSRNSLNGNWVFSPRLLMDYTPSRNPDWVFKLGTGLYRQQPFYRELLLENGQITDNPRTQSSWHIVGSSEYNLTWWGREFSLQMEAYYKALWDLIPYQFENVRVQYYPNHTAKGYAAGFEARLAGEFIEGTESWFSMGILSTQEQIDGVDSEMVRRPTDQRFKLGFVFEDHIPNDPSLRVNLSLQYGSGLPIGPPGDLTQRNLFTGDSYTRVDITFSKVFAMKAPNWDNIRIGIGIYNLLGSKNAVTYTWIEDFGGNSFAVPNNLTGRLFNLVVSTRF